jgi:NADH:ubiquinone oxidoreductase subunit 6 (subunit J)
MIVNNILLLALGFVSVCSAVAVVQAATPVKSVLSLILVFISFFGFALLLGAEFLAMAYAIVYMGAIAILFFKRCTAFQ